ncbi:probable inactive DNA (cytosine-5)-methyltransferase DRM3 isoform X1 [Prosopis cineraria]|uniref:probable inactive DNA (cytosine-5)-methyltransferase DRM3 isoform X1 n=1 Tax=Prosopis cineraria TaxID=364024 RepID=UPI002410B5DD|nr:probable inactive DNA (cytosine-5)-methyltransferase DRM3 isoform X1 [Prosopis cineraria]XP_054805686.1 probable inactive DNA (cytosine-5)-methyltransferase DRM3 isoform X1 [Prosopis cineraria]
MEGKRVVIPKTEVLDYELPSYTTCPRDVGDNVASSSGGNIREFFIGMGFLPCLVDKVIKENGEGNADQLLETLFAYSALEKSNSQSSDSLDSLFDDKDTPEISTGINPKEEPGELCEVNDDRRASLLRMNFPVKEVDFAMQKLGDNAPIHKLVDVIVAAQIAKNIEKEKDDVAIIYTKNEVNNEKLFGTMEKTLKLLEMGFSEREVSSAIEKLGTEAPILELANCIVAEQNGINYVVCKYPPASSSCSTRIKKELNGTEEVKTENFGHEPLQSRDVNLEEPYRGKRVKDEYAGEFPVANSSMEYSNFEENNVGKRPKQEHYDVSTSPLDPDWVEEKVNIDTGGLPKLYKPNPSRCLNIVAAKPPYFLYGNIASISYDSWGKISQFLYALEPEFVNTQFFSAVSRREGYVHNLPTENRFRIVPMPPMTIADAIPHIKKWWPSWDPRKQLSCISCETSGIAQHCDRLGRTLANSIGTLTSEQKQDILHHCHSLNLVWVGKNKLGPMEPEHLEVILGYPLHHTRIPDISLRDRLNLLKYCFQTDTLGYHLSTLKAMFPDGLTLLSIFSGIGGAEVALHRLGIKIKNVVSIESSEAKRKVLKRWWQTSGQKGELVQIEEVQKLTSSRLDGMIKKFGGIDLVICQNPSSCSSPKSQGGQTHIAFDFSLFYEFVRVVQRVRSLCERR